MTNNLSRVFVDADACPVKDEIVQISKKYGIDVVFVISYAHASSNFTGNFVYVDSDKEAVDLYIMNHTKSKDIVVTQDIGLASILVKSGVYVISPRGKAFLEKDMETALDLRFLNAKQRRSGVYSKGPKAFTKEDAQYFSREYEKILSKIAGIPPNSSNS